MQSWSGRTSRRFLRRSIAIAMMAIFLCISLGPLLNPAFNSKSFVHAMTGACVGDCDICGCSPESRASHTCCCSRKVPHRYLSRQQGDLPECCRKAPQAQEVAVMSCGCPCGSGKTEAVVGSSELLPFYFTASLTPPYPARDYLDRTDSLDSRDAEPPDPPPKA